ncbi:MAG: ISL3 family transposase [Williamsia sp.]|nr:ISL3 family transposase [Williamsia sp.]
MTLAFRKGVNYGTAIVDLHLHKVVDMLPDREAATLASWLKDHPEIKIVTRDRFSRYALAVSKSLPDATQVADRWHLLKNMGEAVKKLLERKRQHIIALQSQQAIRELEIEQENVSDQKQEVKLSPRHQLLQQVKKLYGEGKSIRMISRTLGISRNTVKKYISLHEPPQKKGFKTTNLISFSEYLQARIEENPAVETLQLYAEIKAMGYNGKRTILYNYLSKYGQQRNRTRLAKLPAVSWTTAKVKILLCKKEETMEQKDRELIRDICEKSPDIGRVRQLAVRFREIMENKQGNMLSDWIAEVEQSNLGEIKGFARGLLSDHQAVVNALSLPWSNGQVVGQINKLKTIKRQMYGRAGFELLRKRVILHSAYYHQN